MELVSVLTVFATFLLMDGIHGKAGIQYRISSESLNKVSKILTSRPNGYFIYSDEVQVEGQVGTYIYRLTNFRIIEANLTGVKVKVNEENCLHATAKLSKIALEGKVLLTREESTEPVYQDYAKVVFTNGSFISEGKPEYMGVTSKTLMEMPYCSFEAETMSPDSAFSQSVETSVPTDVINKMFNDIVCSVYKLQFSLGFQNTSINLDFWLKVNLTFYPAHLEIKNDTLLLSYMYEVKTHGDDAAKFPQQTVPKFPMFPPVQSSASPFEIWINANVLNDLLSELLERSMIQNKGKLHLNDILPMLLPLPDEITSAYLFFIPQIPRTFPNSLADLYLSDVHMNFVVTSEKFLLQISFVLEIQITLKCNMSKTYTPAKFQVTADVPVQVGYNQERLTMKFVLFGGNVTVIETIIGKIADRFLTNVLYVLPQFDFIASAFEEVSTRINGSKLSQLVPNGTYLHNISISFQQDFLVIHGDLSPEPSDTTNENMTWVPQYSKDYLENLWFPLYDDTPENQKGIPVQDCRIPDITSGTAKYVHTLLMIVFLNSAGLIY